MTNYKDSALIVGILGWIVRVIGRSGLLAEMNLAGLEILVRLVGVGLVVMGMACYLKLKKRSFLWGILPCLSPIGLLVPILIPAHPVSEKKSKVADDKEK